MRDKIVWFLANCILRLGSKWYRERLEMLTDIGLLVMKDEELFELVLDKAKST